MSEKHSVANKAKWANIPPEKRSKIMSKIAKTRMAALTPRQRKKIGRTLTNARKLKGI